jgi:hypothetical protein
MDRFIPIAGSIASVAVLDEHFNDYRWIFGRHAISEAFGANAFDYRIRYRSQVTQFEQFRDRSFQSIRNPLNENQTRLETQLRESVTAWIKVLQNCDDIIARCENVESNETSANISAQDRGASPPILYGQGLYSNQVPATASLHSPLTNDSIVQSHIARDAGQYTQSHSAPPAEPRPNALRRMLRKILAPCRNARRGIEASEHRHQATIGVVPEANSTTANAPLQHRSTAAERWLDRRLQFIELLSELERHNLSSTRRILVTQLESFAADLPGRQRVDSDLVQYRSGGKRLKDLIQCLGDKPQQFRLTFQLLLKSDPFYFHSTLRDSSHTCQAHLKDGNAAFYLRLSVDKILSETADVARSSLPTLNEVDERFFVFSVAQESAEVDTSTEIADLALLFAPITDPMRSDWATFRGHFEGKIRVVSDSTPHRPQRSFAECVTDPNERRILGNIAYAAMRAQLAFVVASALFYKVCAEGPHDVDATQIYYHTALNGRGQEPDYTDSRVLPYVSLDSIGSTSAFSSSANALIRSSGDGLEERMMKNLGILIYEIGTWTRVEAPGLQGRVSIVDDAKEHLSEHMLTKYRDVIHACLSYRQRGDTERWMVQNVISPLDEVYRLIQDQMRR